MYQTSLFFKIKDTATLEKHKIVEIFFKSWVDSICNNEVDYTLTDVLEAPLNSVRWEEIYRVDFERTSRCSCFEAKRYPNQTM